MVFDQSNQKQKKVTKKKQNFLEKINKYFVKKTKFSFKGEHIFFSKTNEKKNIFLKKQKVSKLSVLKNGHFQFGPQKNIGLRTPPPTVIP